MRDGKLMIFAVASFTLIAMIAKHPWRQTNISWAASLDQAQLLAKQTHKKILIDFYSPSCAPCTRLEEDTFSDPQLASMLNDVIMVRVNVDRNQSLANKFQVTAIPKVVALNSQGNPIGGFEGYEDAESVIGFLQNLKTN